MKFVFKLLPFICQHQFKETNQETCQPVLYCYRCGKVKKLPEKHVWEKTGTTYIGAQRNDKGDINQWEQRTWHLECKVCGERTKRNGNTKIYPNE